MARQPGLDGRHRDDDGQIRAKNGDTRLDTLRQTYGDDFAESRRGDMKLGTYLTEEGYDSLTQALRNRKSR